MTICFTSPLFLSTTFLAIVCPITTAQETIKSRDTIHLGPRNGTICLAASPDGKSFARGGAGPNILVYDLATGKERSMTGSLNERVTRICYSPDGKLLAASARLGMCKLWDVASGKELREFTGHKYNLNYLGFTPDGKTLITSSEVVKLWDVATGKELAVLLKNEGPARNVVMTPDGKSLIAFTGTSEDWEVYEIDLTTRKVGDPAKWKVTVGQFDAVDLSPDGKTIACISSNHRKLIFWDVTARKQKAVVDLRSSSYCLAYSPDGKYLAMYGTDERSIKPLIVIWDVATAKPIRYGEGHSDIVYAVAFTPDGKTLISGGGTMDSKLKMWDVPSASNANPDK